MKKALSIGGSDSIAGAGIQADLKTFAALGVYGTTVITSITAQNTQGIQGIIDLHSRFVALQIDAVFSDIEVDSTKIGMLLNNEIINTVGSKLKEYNVKKVVLDPVMYSHGDTPLLNPASKDHLIKKIFPLSLLVTPNIPEARVMTGITIKSYRDIKEAAKRIYKLGAKNVLIKGGHFRGKAVDTLYDGESFRFFEFKRIPGENVHGTGCTLASAIAAELAKGTPLINAIQKAKSYITNSILHSVNLGQGNQIIHHFLDFSSRNSEKYKMLCEMEAALDILKKGEIGCLIPEVQSNLGYGMEGATSKEDIIAFPGRFIKNGNGITTISRPKFGSSSHIGSIILTAMNHDPVKKAAMNIKYAPKIITACKKLNLSVSSFSRKLEPSPVKRKEGNTLEWGTEQTIKKFGSVPNIIYDTGEMGKEPMIRVLGSDPISLAKIILKIKGEYIKTRKLPHPYK